MNNFFKPLKIAAAAAVIAVGFNTQASAAALPFTVNPSNLFGAGYAGAFEADFIAGTSVTRVLLDIDGDGSNNSLGNGYIQFSSFNFEGNLLGSGITGLGTQYDLWGEFTYTLAHTGGNYAQPGSTNQLTSITFDIWVDPTVGASTFDSALDGSSDPSVTRSGTAVQLSTSSFIYAGLADINALGGTAFNSILDFELINPDGPAFFTAPVPFHNITFNEFNNTSQGVTGSLAQGYLRIANTTGGIDFNNREIPEPATLALFAVGLLGVAAGARRRRA